MRDVAHDRLFGLGAGLFVGVGDIDPAGDVDLARRGILPPFRRRHAELALVERRLRRQRLDAGQGREHQAEAVAAAVADRTIGAARHVEWRMRHLYRVRQHLVGRLDGALVVLALVVPAVPMEGIEHQADRLLDDVAAAVEILAQSHELVGPVARADAQPHAAVGQDVDEGGVFDHADRVVERQGDDRRADLDAAGLGREIGHVGEAVRHDAVAGGEVMLGDPGRVVAQPFGLEDLVGRAGMHVAVRVGLFLGIGMRGEKNAEFHVSSLFRYAILGRQSCTCQRLSDPPGERTLPATLGGPP